MKRLLPTEIVLRHLRYVVDPHGSIGVGLDFGIREAEGPHPAIDAGTGSGRVLLP